MKLHNILALLLILVLLGVFIPRTPWCKYTVRPGDSLSKIAAKYSTTVQELVRFNADRYPSLKTNPGLIEPGWVLMLPREDTGKENGESLWREIATWVQTQVIPALQRRVGETPQASGGSSQAPMQIGDPVAEEEILRMFNEERREKGLPELTMDQELRTRAYERTRDMFQRGYFSHNDPDTGEYLGKNTTEILARGCGFATAQDGARRWWDSPGHYQAIIGNFRRVGIGVGYNGSCTIITAQFLP
ncbi:MAG: CAP domain-containing protein [Anaerolineae bacterium]|uniref:CAP domain-containing protein n=1 Tax=Thermogutta sp. TaxID=1962930 RepID=UPI0032208F32